MGIDVRAITFERVMAACSTDSESQALIKVILDGFPSSKEDLPPDLQPYWNIREELTCLQGVPLYNNRIVVPKSLRGEVLESLHSAHQGVIGMKARARASVYWPNINSAITSRRAQCKTCNEIAPSQPAEPHSQWLLPWPRPEPHWRQQRPQLHGQSRYHLQRLCDRCGRRHGRPELC